MERIGNFYALRETSAIYRAIESGEPFTVAIDPSGIGRYIVGIGAGVVLKEAGLSAQTIEAIIDDMARFGDTVGVWREPESKTVYIDYVVGLKDKAHALSFGKDKGEKAIYDTYTGETIAVEYPEPADIEYEAYERGYRDGQTAAENLLNWD